MLTTPKYYEYLASRIAEGGGAQIHNFLVRRGKLRAFCVVNEINEPIRDVVAGLSLILERAFVTFWKQQLINPALHSLLDVLNHLITEAYDDLAFERFFYNVLPNTVQLIRDVDPNVDIKVLDDHLKAIMLGVPSRK